MSNEKLKYTCPKCNADMTSAVYEACQEEGKVPTIFGEKKVKAKKVILECPNGDFCEYPCPNRNNIV